MTVKKIDIINGVIRYIRSEVIGKITDKPLKMVLAACVSAIEMNSSLVDSIFTNDIVTMILPSKDGEYDLDNIFEILEKTITEYGDFPVTIPPIKFISSSEKQLTFTSSDIHRLKTYISGGRVS